MNDDDLITYALLGLALFLPCTLCLFIGLARQHALVNWINCLGRAMSAAVERMGGARAYAPARLALTGLLWVYKVTKPIASPDWRAASRTAICIYGTLALTVAVSALIAVVVADQSELLPFEIALAPLFAGVLIGFLAPPAIVTGINGATERTAAYYLRTRQDRSDFLKWTLNPALWINDKIFSLTQKAAIGDGWRAAIRLSAALYLVALVLLSMYLVVALVVALVVIAAAFWIASQVMDWQTEGASADSPTRSAPLSGGATTSKMRHGFFGDYEEHRDKTGTVVGTSRVKQGFFGAYTEHRDAQDTVTGSTKLKEGFFGQYAEHRDREDNVTGTSKSREGFFGPYTEHRDTGDQVTGESREKEGFFGPYTEHTPKK